MLRARPRSNPRRASESRAWTVAQKLRGRRDWLLDGASFQRSWSVQVGAVAFKTSAHVSFFMEAQGMVVALKPSFRRAMPHANVDDAIQYLRAALGERYRVHPLGDGVVTTLRSATPKQLLAEIAHVEHGFGGRAARRFGPSPRSQDARRWYVVEALRASSWALGSLSFSRVVGDNQRRIHASIGVLVDSAWGRPGLTASFGTWAPRTDKRWTKFRDDTAVGLTAEGFRVDEKSATFFHAGRWIAGLSGPRALKQADMFDDLIGAGSSVVG